MVASVVESSAPVDVVEESELCWESEASATVESVESDESVEVEVEVEEESELCWESEASATVESVEDGVAVESVDDVEESVFCWELEASATAVSVEGVGKSPTGGWILSRAAFASTRPWPYAEFGTGSVALSCKALQDDVIASVADMPDAVGGLDSNSANTPATCGDAWDVPLMVVTPPVRRRLTMFVPGAATSIQLPWFED